MKNAINKSLPIVTLLLLALLAAAPLWGPGIVSTRAGGDSPFLLWRTQQMAVSLRAGVFPVRWMPDAAYGYGYPFFNYYAALPYYLAAFLNIAGLDILAAIKLTQTLGFVASALAMYGWTRRRLGRTGAWLAAVGYTFATFHLVNVYTRGDSLSEFYAFVFYPLILWAIDCAFDAGGARPAAALALAFGGLYITHNLSAAIFTPFALLYIAIRAIYARTRGQALLCCAMGLGLGLALSAWCWAPFSGETSYGQLGEQTTGYFNYSNHFRRADLVQPTLAFDYEVGRTTPFATSSAQAALAVLGVAAIVVIAVRRRKIEALPAFTLAGLVISTGMITPLSKSLWDHLPILPLVQFPWRFLSVQALFTALATAQISDLGSSSGRAARNMQYAAAGLGSLLVATSLVNLHPARLYITPADVTTERLQLYEMFTANIGTTIRYEYLPRQVVPRLYTSDALIEPGQPMRAAAIKGDASASLSKTAPTQQTWQATAGSSGATVAFPILWWPGWQASVDGKPAAIRPANSSGRIVLDLTPGAHVVTLSLGRTPLRAVAESVSLVAVIVLIGLAAFSRRRDAKTSSILGAPGNSEWSRAFRRIPAQASTPTLGNLERAEYKGWFSGHGLSLVSGIIIWVVALAIFFARSASPATADDETMDFISQPYLHYNPGGAVLKPDLRLTSYSFSADELAAGQTLDVHLSWINAGRQQTVTVSLVSPAQHLVGLDGAPTLAESSAAIAQAASQTTAAITVPSETPRGIYLIQVQTESDAVYLRPVRIHNDAQAGDAPVLAHFGDGGRIRLHRVEAEQVTPTQLAVTLDWSAAQPVEANYAVALRLRGVASIDTQPGYGFLPTSLWRPGELVSDRYTLELPEGTPPGNDYQIEVFLYDAATLAGVGDPYILGNVALPLFSRRPVDSPVLARLGPEMALAALDIPPQLRQGEPALTIHTGWLATATQSTDRAARWTIYDSSGAPVFTQTTDLVAGSPSSAWPEGGYVAGQTRLNIPVGLAPGSYRLGVTVLNLRTQSEEGSYLASSTFEIAGHPRSFTMPPMQSRSNVEFGQQIRLLGYDLKYQLSNIKSQIGITLYWQAMAAPQGDYKVFVHLFDPTTEQIAAQHDAMPLDGRYPTSWWAAGEVVSETVTLNLADMKPGAYRLAVGLYDARTATRLVAVGPDGARLAADRVVLPEIITIP